MGRLTSVPHQSQSLTLSQSHQTQGTVIPRTLLTWGILQARPLPVPATNGGWFPHWLVLAGFPAEEVYCRIWCPHHKWGRNKLNEEQTLPWRRQHHWASRHWCNHFQKTVYPCKGLSTVSADVGHWYWSWCPEQRPPIGLRDIQGERRQPDLPGAQA